jgi:hypothetical protein
MARAGPVSSGGGGLGPARFGSLYRKRLRGAFRIYGSANVLASRLGSCDRRHKLPSDHPSFFGHAEVCPNCGVFSGRWRTHGDDRVSDAHASHHCDICHSDSSELGGHLDSAETHLVTSFGPAQFLQAFEKCCQTWLSVRTVRGHTHKHADAAHEHADAAHAFGLLRARRNRPRGRSAGSATAWTTCTFRR